MTFGARERFIFLSDFRVCFSLRRLPVYVAFAAAGVMLVVQRGELPPVIVVCAAVLCSLERQFNAIFSRTGGELAALTLLPVDWEGVVLAKNLATLAAVPVTGICMGSVMLYFSPRSIDLPQWADAAEYLWSVMFLLVVIGNLRSSQDPHPLAHGTRDALIQAGGMVIVLLVCSLPYIIFHVLGGNSAGALLTGCAAGTYWLRRSIPGTARRALHYFETV
jgi:ABC-type transport system involved in cytochrome c biogenesis permease component